MAVEKELYGDDFRQPARLSPLEAKALLLALDLIGPLVAADSGTPLATVRAKVEASFGGYSMQEAPEPGSSPLPEDVLSVLSSGVREHRVVRMEYLSRRGEGVGTRVIEPHRIRGVRGDWYVDTYDRTADGERTFRVDRIRSAELDDEVFAVRPGVGDRDDDELSKTAGTASVWFSPDVARWELEGRPDTIPLADGAALASVPYGSERWLATELCRYLGDAVLLEPEGLRARRRGTRTRARSRAARAVRRATRHPVIRYLSDDEVEGAAAATRRGVRARASLAGRARGRARRPAAQDLGAAPRPDGFVNAMPAYCSVPDAVAVKIVGVYQSNRARGLPTIAGVVISIDPDTGRIRGILGAGALTAARTAAATGRVHGAARARRPRPARHDRRRRRGAHAPAGRGRPRLARRASCTTIGPPTSSGWPSGPASHLPAVRVGAAASPADAAEGAACVVTGIPIGARGGQIPRRVGARGRAGAADRLLDVGRRRARELRRAARERRPRPARRGRPRSATSTAGARSTAPVGRWLADGGPARPPGRVVVANLGVGAHDAVFCEGDPRSGRRARRRGTLLAE